MTEADEGTVIVGFRVIGTGRVSGIGTEMEIWQVWEIADDLRPTRVREFHDREAALEAAGTGKPAPSLGEGGYC